MFVNFFSQDSAILHYDSSSTLDATFNKIAREQPSAMKSRNNRDCFEFSEDISETADFLKKVRKNKPFIY